MSATSPHPLRAGRALIAALAILGLAPTTTVAALADGQEPPMVETPARVVDRMLSLAKVRSVDRVVDLGSGDGRIVLEAASRFGARGLGVEMRGDLVEASRRQAEKLGIADRAEFRQGDIFTTDLRDADVLTLYLSADFNERLMPRILKEMRPGARVVSHDFALGTWRPDAMERFEVSEKNHGHGGESTLMLWIVPANVAGRWRASVGEGSMQREFEFSLVQQFQVIEGALRTERGHRRFARATLRAGDIALVVTDAPSPYAKGTVNARIDGDRMSGTFRFDETSAVGAPFRAQRIDSRPELFD